MLVVNKSSCLRQVYDPPGNSPVDLLSSRVLYLHGINKLTRGIIICTLTDRVQKLFL